MSGIEEGRRAVLNRERFIIRRGEERIYSYAKMEAVRRLECPHCAKTFKNTSDQNRHIREKHPEEVSNPAPLVTCEECGEFESRSRAELISHMRTHEPGDKFRCDECDFKCKHKKTLNSHKRKQHGDGKDLHRCTHVKKLRREEAIRRGDEVMEVCNQAFATLGQLTKHEKQVHPPADPDYPELGPNSFPCEGCVIRFNTKQGLRDHLKRNNCFSMQAKKLEDRDTIRKKTLHPCKIGNCTKSFRYPKEVQEHRQNAHGMRLCWCECGKTFIDQDSLNGHQKLCRKMSAAPESTYGLFDDDVRNRDNEPIVRYCQSCTADMSLDGRRRSDAIGWNRTVAKYGSMTYALVPLPEKDFNGGERVTASEGEIIAAMRRVRGNYREGLSLPVVRYRTRPQASEDELFDLDS